MLEWKGIAASTGYAMGSAYRLPELPAAVKSAVLSYPGSKLDKQEIDKEADRLAEAVRQAAQDIAAWKREAAAAGREAQARIFATHLSLLQDPEYIGEVTERIKGEGIYAESALRAVTDELVALFGAMENEVLRERCADLEDVAGQLHAKLHGGDTPLQVRLTEPAVIVGVDIPPSLTARLDRRMVLGIALEKGGRTSHSAIIARSLGIPAVVGIRGLLSAIQTGDEVIVDGRQGIVITTPEQSTTESYATRQREEAVAAARLARFKSLPTATADGHAVQLAINIAHPQEAEAAREVGAEGIGLYRTEFLFMDRSTSPSEDEQFQAYRSAVMAIPEGSAIIIRTLDVGGDKAIPYLQRNREELNPFLGYRGIRLCLDREYSPLFKTQLRAILRASACGKLKIMYPMIATLKELRAASALLQEAKLELDEAGLPYDPKLEAGIMIEVPAAAMIADQLAKEADFFSIGTNDLVQYMMAADRMNEAVSHLAEPLQPAILRVIDRVIQCAHKEGKWAGMCGEMAGHPLAIPLLLGLGLDEFSMSASALLPARELIARLDYAECRRLAQQALQLESAEEIQRLAAEACTPNVSLESE
ncbi:phosphoenolpyruvate--protein phosphotransferase [Paenibacillus sp. J5C_2022]|uniref:phosphoenolpyruvate--protein phosphotransferase n=1 Tax=Paenibacillus sp. J5C2022 TaxID=2977129 RepID=UPI0021CEAE1A|nr:phosphoenolpyruvate--protein phosphotransferase [Paenibacillus sp. J5C2022]MCU6710538.1 phosphoenolpyruvate--protein phosphotransferase [Paenibacillus sp. J5C2022]